MSAQAPQQQSGPAHQSAPTIPTAAPAAGGAPANQGAATRTPPARLAPANRTLPRSSVPTPQWLRRASVAAVLLSLVTGLVTLGMMLQSRSSLEQQQSATAQLDRIQTIRTELQHADAVALSAQLQGPEQPEQLAEYDRSLAAASQAMISAGQAQPADQEALSALNTQVLDYARSIEQARAQSRAGNPLTENYLKQASDTLRTGAVPTLEALSKSNSDRITQHSASPPLVVPILLGAATLAVLIWVMVQCARRFRRILNPGLLAASISMLLLLIMAAQQLTTLSSLDNEINGSVSATGTAANTRAWANEARSREVLGVLDPTNVDQHQSAWQEASQRVQNADLTPLQVKLWDAYADHVDAVEKAALANAGEARATARDGKTFEDFDKAITGTTQDGSRLANRVDGQRTTLTVTAVVAGLLTVLAVGGSLLGLRRRAREYQ